MEQNISEILCHKAEELIRLGLNGPSVAGQLTDTVDNLLISEYESAVKGSHKLRVTSNKLKTKDSKNSSLVTRYSLLSSDLSLSSDPLLVTRHLLLVTDKVTRY